MYENAPVLYVFFVKEKFKNRKAALKMFSFGSFHVSSAVENYFMYNGVVYLIA